MDEPKVLKMLSRTLPTPWRPPPKAQGSWQQLKPGQRLRSRMDVMVGGLTVPAGTVWEVHGVDSQGATLTTREVTLRWTRKEWKGAWERVRGRGASK